MCEYIEGHASLALGFDIYVKTLVCDGRVRSIKEGLYGEDFVASYKYIYTLSLIPNWLRSTISFVLENFAGEPRKARLNKVLGELSVYHNWQNIADLKRYQQHWIDTLKAFELDGIICPGGALPALRHGQFRNLQPSFSYTTLFNLLDWPAGVVPITTVTGRRGNIRWSSNADSYDRVLKRKCKGPRGYPLGFR